MSNNLIYVSPLIFQDKSLEVPGLDNFLEMQRIFALQVGIKDRTGTITTPFQQTVVNPIPVYDNTFNMSYTDCAMSRVAELEKIHNETGKTFRLLYSGGIDSSGILAACIAYFGVEKSSKVLEICCSKESMYENPWMWDRYIAKHNFKLISSHRHNELWDDNVITLMGEGNDQLMFMTSTVQPWSRFIAPKDAFCRVDESLLRCYLKEQYNITSDIVISNFVKVIQKSPFPLDNMYMILWWLGMSLAWDSVILRTLVATNIIQYPADYLKQGLPQFYNTSEFQQWSFHTMKNFTKDKVLDYKTEAKDMVIKLLDLPEYVNKGKSMSWPRLHAMVPTKIAIDNNLRLYQNVEDLMQFTQSNNSFI